MLDPEPNFISMYTNSSDSQNLTTLDHHTSLTDYHNESAGTNSNFTRYVEPKWGEKSETNSLIFLVLVVLCLFFMLVKFTCCWQRSQQASSRRLSGIRVASVHGDATKDIKTEEYITNRLVLKHVVKYATEQQLDDEERATRLETTIVSSDFQKSDLAIPDGSNNDEVDKENDSVVCAICLCEYEVGDQICWSYNESCRHHFHSACGIAWLAKHSECPVCRSLYLVEPPREDQAKNKETAQVEMVGANEPDRLSSPDTTGRESQASQNPVEPSEEQGDSRV